MYLKVVAVSLFCGVLHAQDNADERFNAKLQELHRKERILIREFQTDCRKRMAGGVLQQQGEIIVCVVPPPPAPPKPDAKEAPKP